MLSERRRNSKWRNLFLVRHGESTANEVNRFAGMVDAPLTRLGRAQASKAARNWKDQRVDTVFVSPLSRANQTARILRDNLETTDGSKPELTTDGRLSERNFGSFTLRNKTLIQREIGLVSYEAALYGDSMTMGEGESFEVFYERILTFLRDELHPLLVSGQRVLVVAHKYVIELLSRLILRLPVESGYDLRLPNAKVIVGNELASYIKRESRKLNLLMDWIVTYHAHVLLASVLIGLLLRTVGGERIFSPAIAIGLISLATVISLARVMLLNVKFVFEDGVLPAKRLLFRYALLPLGVMVLGNFMAPFFAEDFLIWVFALALLFAAPTAITALTISRSAGGMVHPSVITIVLTTSISAMVMYLLLDAHGYTDRTVEAFSYVSLSIAGLFLPLGIARFLRYTYPITTAKFAERHGATAILLLALFIILAFQSIDLNSFWPYGVVALGAGLVIRIAAVLLARRGSLYAIDDYVSMSYPNIFLVIVLAEMLNLTLVSQVAIWFLVPMFALAPLDEKFCSYLSCGTEDARLLSFLKVERPMSPVLQNEES
ncbi:MAG: histidine phosphatase family protein [Gammaproteobacteria bacterium]|nr:histidine phosphatase family protein [Gammaproteobacteria bacterium]